MPAFNVNQIKSTGRKPGGPSSGAINLFTGSLSGDYPTYTGTPMPWNPNNSVTTTASTTTTAAPSTATAGNLTAHAGSWPTGYNSQFHRRTIPSTDPNTAPNRFAYNTASALVSTNPAVTTSPITYDSYLGQQISGGQWVYDPVQGWVWLGQQ